MSQTTDTLDLLEYRRIVAAMYEEVRQGDMDATSWSHWRTDRDELFATHPQSPLSSEVLDGFSGLPYFPYDPSWRLEAGVESIDDPPVQIGHSGEGATTFRPFGVARIRRQGVDLELVLYWLTGYGGGVFLPFRDGTSGTDTYGGGRYLLDTVKGADLGHTDDMVVLDFNYAYHPSCVHDDRWSCPLAPPENWLSVDVRAGERL